MYVNSKKEKLDAGQIIGIFLENNPQPHPPQVMMPAILEELNQPNCKVHQIGNTLFEVHTGEGGKAFFKAFNADVIPNFVENSKQFVVWARRMLNLNTLVTEFDDPALEQLFKVISMKPPLPGMGYQAFRMDSGKTRIFLNLGE
jgi:hypothetical protein